MSKDLELILCDYIKHMEKINFKRLEYCEKELSVVMEETKLFNFLCQKFYEYKDECNRKEREDKVVPR